MRWAQCRRWFLPSSSDCWDRFSIGLRPLRARGDWLQRRPPTEPLFRRAYLAFSQLQFVRIKLLCRFDHLVAGVGRIVPALDLNSFAFEILINGKEVSDLLEHVRVDIGVVPHIGVARIVL